MSKYTLFFLVLVYITVLVKRQETQKPNLLLIVVEFRIPHLPFNAPKKHWDLYNFNNMYKPLGSPDDSINNYQEFINIWMYQTKV
ncbi:hypothetical protein [Aestuariibaculum suncheonense]|uniref:Uncharacterized protein n=1 Tax=Aestuariibaculum suncheonense TaxID=1028745 RepID=A0A8J6UKX9_9FLAO|nr:hypothetical protein [Aestuariibaculum suncheonense]MBD0836071.1 hypothetical protein [Aestuariibaculum suncheonense]